MPLAPCAPYHGRLAVVGRQLVGDAAVEVERVHVRGQPALGVHAEEPLGVELAREGQARHERVYVDGLAGVAVGKGHFGSRPVDFHLLAGLVVDVHGEALGRGPFGVAVVERGRAAGSRPARAAAVAIFLIEERSSNALALELLVDPFVVRVGEIPVLAELLGVEEPLYRVVAQIFGQRPLEPGLASDLEGAPRGAGAAARRGRDVRGRLAYGR